MLSSKPVSSKIIRQKVLVIKAILAVKDGCVSAHNDQEKKKVG